MFLTKTVVGKALVILTVLLVVGIGCKKSQELAQPANAIPAEVPSIMVMSPAFAKGDTIPVKYTCDGEDISPWIKWDNPPEGTLVFALVCDDPDAPSGDFVHWVIYDIPASSRGLEEGIPATPDMENGSKQGRNGFGNIGYGGPCPPPGDAHRYLFRLYALDALTGLSSGATKEEVTTAIEGHIIARGGYMGRYQRTVVETETDTTE